MAPEVSLDSLLASVSDGATVDWDALERAAPDADARELMRCLRELAEVADAHRRLDAEASVSDEGSAASSADSVESAGAEASTALDGSGPPGRAWGPFTLLEKLGEGSFGVVYRAWDPQLERDVAIKLIHPEVARRDAPGTRLLREGRAVARVKHENVVIVFGVEAHDDQVGLCMEYVQGCTIDDIIRQQGTMSVSEAIAIGRHVCGALAAVHAASLVHRDVKARNVMREEASGRIVLMDFGAGLKIQPGREANVPIAGTPLYMAPEVLFGDPPSPRSDVYSVGVLLYYLVSGRFPIEGSSLGEIRAAHGRGARRFLAERRSDVAVGFARVVERALDANPDNRQANAASLLHDLRRLEMAESEHARGRVPWTVRTGRRLRQQGLKLVGGASLSSLGILWLGFLNSWSYNYMLGLEGEFVHDTPLSWLRWGAKAMVAPVVVAAILSLFSLVILEVVRLARKVSPPIDEVSWALSRRVHVALGLAGYGPATALAFTTVVASFAFLAWAYYGYFADLALAVGTPVAAASGEQLRLLAPSNEPQQQLYRQVFTLGLIGMAGGWLGVWRLARNHGERVRPAMLGAGGVSLFLVLTLLSQPYRIFLWNEAERVAYGLSTCYVVSEAGDKTLLFCPTQTPREQVVSRSDRQLARSGQVESIFTPFAGPLVTSGR